MHQASACIRDQADVTLLQIDLFQWNVVLEQVPMMWLHLCMASGRDLPREKKKNLEEVGWTGHCHRLHWRKVWQISIKREARLPDLTKPTFHQYPSFCIVVSFGKSTNQWNVPSFIGIKFCGRIESDATTETKPVTKKFISVRMFKRSVRNWVPEKLDLVAGFDF